MFNINRYILIRYQFFRLHSISYTKGFCSSKEYGIWNVWQSVRRFVWQSVRRLRPADFELPPALSSESSPPLRVYVPSLYPASVQETPKESILTSVFILNSPRPKKSLSSIIGWRLTFLTPRQMCRWPVFSVSKHLRELVTIHLSWSCKSCFLYCGVIWTSCLEMFQ